MRETNSNTIGGRDSSMRIIVTDTCGNKTLEHALLNGNSVILGSNSNCGLYIPDTMVSEMHCVIRIEDDEVWVRDWCSKHGTFVNDVQIIDETRIQVGDVVRIGESHIRLCADIGRTVTANPTQCIEDVKAIPAIGSNRGLLRKSHPAIAADPTVSKLDRPASPPCFEEEALELMQSEIEMLQAEIADRDRKIADLESRVKDDHQIQDDVAESDESHSLLARMDDLLHELDHSDRRVRSLEELLRTSEEKERHEQEERRQLESWLDDLESRVRDGEATLRAENEALQRRVERLSNERKAEQQMKLAEDSNSGEVCLGEQINRLRDELEEAHHRLRTEKAHRQDLESRLESMRDQQSQAGASEFNPEKIRAEQLKLAQERAALSREQAALTRKLAEHEACTRQKDGNNDVDQRFQAFRQTLKELHQTDRETEQQQGRRLGARILELWRRLDGPTDSQ